MKNCHLFSEKVVILGRREKWRLKIWCQPQNPRALQKACLELYEKYVADKINIAEVDIPLQKESFRQRDMLERKVWHTKK